MSVQQLEGLVLVAVVNHGPVVAAEDEERIICNVQAVQRAHDFAHSPVQLQDDVTAGAQTALSGEAGMRYARHVHVLRAQVEEEWFVLVGSDEVLGLAGDDVGDVLVRPQGGFSSGHPPDARDAVDDGVVMPLAGFHLHQFGVLQSGRPVSHLVAVIHGDGVPGVEAHHASVLHEHAGHAVYGGGYDVFVVEADVVRIGFDEAVEVGASLGSEA